MLGFYAYYGCVWSFTLFNFGIDLTNDMIKSILDNIEKLNFWGDNMRYKFRYINGTYKIIAFIGAVMQNFFFVIAAFMLLYYVVNKIITLIGVEDSDFNIVFNSAVRKAMPYCAFTASIVFCILKKGVFLYNDKLVIARYTFTLTNWNPRITISYNEIEHVNVNYSDLHFTRYRFAVVNLSGDESYNIELTLKNGKKLFFSIQDQEEFCSQLELLMNKYNEFIDKHCI